VQSGKWVAKLDERERRLTVAEILRTERKREKPTTLDRKVLTKDSEMGQNDDRRKKESRRILRDAVGINKGRKEGVKGGGYERAKGLTRTNLSSGIV